MVSCSFLGASGRAPSITRPLSPLPPPRPLQEDIEREELRVELALSEKAHRRRLEELHHASLDVNGGIDAFEINMKRLVRGDAAEGE